jgi:hypothetical protein
VFSKSKITLSILALLAAPWGGSPYVNAEVPTHLIPPPLLLIQPITQTAATPLIKLELAAFPLAPAGTYANSYAPANCTWYVASMKRIPDSWGNAATWASRAQAEGITVSPIPVIGAIAQHAGGLGHVAVVRAISGPMVLIDEMNYDYNGSVRQSWQPASSYVYIYI